MPKLTEPAPSIEVRNRADLRSWLSKNAQNGIPHWLITYKKHTEFYVSFGELVSELLCWGWIDSKSRSVDRDRTSVYISPRNPKSAWSAVNKAKVEQARNSGQMTEAGEALIAQAMANGMWTFLDDVERLELPADLKEALSRLNAAWEEYPRSIKRSTLEWIKSAKTASTRAKRIRDVRESLKAGQRPTPFRS